MKTEDSKDKAIRPYEPPKSEDLTASVARGALACVEGGIADPEECGGGSVPSICDYGAYAGF